MSEEKVSFGFEFGLKGEKEVKKVIEDLYRLIGHGIGGNGINLATSLLGKAGGLLELGAAAAPIGAVAAAVGVLAYKSYEAGENLRRIRQDMVRLDRVPSMALSDSELGENSSEVVNHFRDLGLEAGNQFQASLATKLGNIGNGIKSVFYNIYAHDASLLGFPTQSYEQSSPEAKDAIRRLKEDQQVQINRTAQASRFMNENFTTNFGADSDILALHDRGYLPPEDRHGQATRDTKYGTEYVHGILPESYQGQKYERDTNKFRYGQLADTMDRQIDFSKKKLADLLFAPLQNKPGTTIPDESGRNQEILKDQSEINDLVQKELGYRREMADIDAEQRQANREYARNQNYGSYRTLGLGGVGFQDQYSARGQGLNSMSEALMGHHGRVAAGHFGMGNLSQPFVHAPEQKKQTDILESINKIIKGIGIPMIGY